MQVVADLVQGKSVALVGNSQLLLREDRAAEIDAHDVVLRMNLGLPSVVGPRVGRKTTIWSQGLWFKGHAPPDGCRAVVFMKLTQLGDIHWPHVQRAAGDVPCLRWPQDLEREVQEFVGAEPSSGIRWLYWLKRHASPSRVACYGMDCWKKMGNTWSTHHRIWNHKPQLERAAMERLMA